MSLTLPITRNIVVAEKRDYVLSYTFCELGVVPNNGNIVAKAFPRFASPSLFVGFLGSTATVPVTQFFSPGDKLWRRTGTKTGKMTPFSQELEYPVAEVVPDANAINLSHSIIEGVLRITVPFGSSFTRYVNPETGVMSLDDGYLPNDPAKYYYAVLNGDLQIGGGTIDITIDLGEEPVTDSEPTVCSVQVT